jgi:hypothetical protein
MQAQAGRVCNGSEAIFSPPDELHPTLGGASVAQLSDIFAPKPERLRQMLLELRKQHHWSQGFAVGVLGVSLSALVKWEAGTRNPNGAAAKLIFLLHSLLVEGWKSQKCVGSRLLGNSSVQGQLGFFTSGALDGFKA